MLRWLLKVYWIESVSSTRADQGEALQGRRQSVADLPARRSDAPSRRLSLTGLCLALWCCLGCFEEPVKEHLHLRFDDEGQVGVELSVSVRRTSRRPSLTLDRRLEDLETELLGGFGPWTSRFSRVEPLAEGYGWNKELGELVEFRHEVLVEGVSSVNDLLGDTSIFLSYREVDGTADYPELDGIVDYLELDGIADIAELTLSAGSSQRATLSERRRVEGALGEWSTALAAYFEAAETVWKYLDKKPHRALAVLSQLFDLEEEPLSESEKAMLQPLVDSMSAVVEVLDADDKTALSLDELSRRVYDPFPASLTIEVPGRPLVNEGFIAVDGGFAVPERSLWQAFRYLEGIWLSPDPLIAWVDHLRTSSDDPFDVAAFADRPRQVVDSPSAAEVAAAVTEGLRPPGNFLLAWELPPPAEAAEP